MENSRIAALSKKTQWSFAVSMLSLLLAFLLLASDMAGKGTLGGAVLGVCVYIFLIAGVAFLVFLGMLVHCLGRNAVLWLILVVFFSPIAAIVAVVRVRQIVEAKLQSDTHASQSTANVS